MTELTRRRRYQLAYAAIGLVGAAATTDQVRAAVHAAWADGLTPEDYGAGTAAAMALDQAALGAVIDVLIEEAP